jgi:SAM-dependent methyltransferase
VYFEAEAMKKLDDSQVESFDTDYVTDARWETVRARIDQDFPNGDFRFLDLGGGNGVFTDCLLEAFPKARGTVLDNSELLLSRNRTNDRKTLICESVENLGRITERFDLVSVHWLLHHLIDTSYGQTRRNQSVVLENLGRFLTTRGRISLFENMCNGWLVDNLPGQMIYQITSTKAIAAITRRMGANTAGVGVCYLSKKAWFSTIRNSGLEILEYSEPDNWVWPLRAEWRIFLHMRNMRVGHFWLRLPGAS